MELKIFNTFVESEKAIDRISYVLFQNLLILGNCRHNGFSVFCDGDKLIPYRNRPLQQPKLSGLAPLN